MLKRVTVVLKIKKTAPIGSQSAQTANTEAQEPSDNISSEDSITNISEKVNNRGVEKPGTVSMEEMYGLRPKAEKPPVSHQMYLRTI